MVIRNGLGLMGAALALAALSACTPQADTPAGNGSSSSGGGSSSSSSSTGGASDAGNALPDASIADPEYPCPADMAAFDEAHPGTRVSLMLSRVNLIGQPMAVGVGGFQPAAREDFGPPHDTDLPIDGCVVGGAVPFTDCSVDGDCSPEQHCVPERGLNGGALPNSLHCETPRAYEDVGAFEATGFTDGPRTFTYNADKGGNYTSSPDGSIPNASFAFDADYVFTGDGMGAFGLGRYRGTLHVPAQTEIVSPAPSPNMLGAPQIPVSTTHALDLAWSGSSTGEVEFALSGLNGNMPAVVRCLAKDDGTFTVPADMVAAAHFGSNALFNTLTIKRRTRGTVCGQGVSTSTVTSESSVLVYVLAQP